VDACSSQIRCLHLKQPVAGAPALLARARELLTQIAPDRPVSALRIELAALGSAPIQLSFPIAVGVGTPRRERLDVVAHRLRERFGPGAARRAHLIADAMLPEDGVAWEDYGRLPPSRPRPIAVQVDVEGRPTALRRGAGPWEAVRAVYTQWRIRTNWWAAPTHRHYYRLETTGGTIVDVYHEQCDGRWHLVTTRD
jgi:ribosomal protein S16